MKKRIHYRHGITNNDNATGRKNNETNRNPKNYKPVPRCKQKRSKIPRKNSGKCRILKQQTKDRNPDTRENRYNTIAGNDLDENIQTNNRKNTFGRKQPIRKRENYKQTSGLVRKQRSNERYRNKNTIETRTFSGKTKSPTGTITPTRRRRIRMRKTNQIRTFGENKRR